ncbi:SET domain-containing protein-lysine N-methyltransferase [uncultured Hyphomonas sp.]|uniref:SET domain-containing protein n=1 Tax=uncultured Hyphomonas sp. TaxID=225298 RepID=UPI002AAAB2C4|nr:SET domain-containing protein-lysine N-methyltransferase [uncultured Hyphomonas sp.]
MFPDNQASLVEVKQSPLHGRGLYAVGDLAAGSRIGTWPTLILSAEDTDQIRSTRLYHYVFYVDESTEGAMRAAIAFGPISMCNHSTEANAIFTVDADAATVTLSACRDIAAGEEVLIDYGDFAAEAV